MEVAVNYRRYLADLLWSAGGRPRSEHRTLDFGAGVGTYARTARHLGYQVTCVELDAELCQRLVEDDFVSSHSTTDFDDGTFDFAYTLNVLEHIEDHEATLRELHRVIVPGGRLLVYVPAFPVLFSAMDRKVGHVRRYRRAQLADLVTRAGFHLDVCEHADSLGFLASLAFKAIGNSDGTLTEGPVAFYDRWAFPLSRRLDRITRPAFGKNLVAIATRPLAVP
ncbi:MAG: methyltransferase domain-containing protein [Actinomycetota bacterium]|nr:methyltransferase domain-containing protein [Actinomycetota bacterium]